MRDLDQLVTALREQAEGVKPVALLAGVRHGARRMRRRRQVAALTGVVVVVVGAVGGSALVSRGHGSRSAPASPSTAATAAKAVTASSAAAAPPVRGLDRLVGKTWYVASWEVGGKRGVPTTNRPPTLRFLPPHGNSGAAPVSVFDGLTSTPLTATVSPGPQIVTWASGFLAGSTSTDAVRQVDLAFAAVLTGLVGVELDPSQLTLQSLAGHDSITFVSNPPPTGTEVNVLLAKTWYLTTVEGNGRRWSPGAVSTLAFTTTSTATTNDGTNDTSWVVTLTPHQVSWVPGESTAVGESAVPFQIGSVELSVFSGRTDWSFSGGRLVLTGSNGTVLTYTTTRPPTPQPYSGALIFLDNNPPGGHETGGQSLNLISGQVTIKDAQGTVAWSGLVTAADGGDSKLPPGPYTISAVVQGGSCAPLAVTVVADQVSEVTVVCATTQPTAAQP